METILAVVGLSVALTGSAVWFFRSAITNLTTNNNKLVSDLKQDIKSIKVHVDNQLETINVNIEKKNKEVADQVYRQVNEVKQYIRELEVDNKNLNETLHEIDKNMLQFKLDALEKYAEKDEVKQLWDRVDALAKK